MKRTTLAFRIGLLAAAVATLTALLAGALAFGLLRNSGAGTARQTLQRLADLAQATADDGRAAAPNEPKLRLLLGGLNIRSGVIEADGSLTTTAPIVRNTLTAADIHTVQAGNLLSLVRQQGGDQIFIEARPTRLGGIVLAERRADAVAPTLQALRRLLVALAISGVASVLLGLGFAWRLSAPLRHAAAAAHALARGDRDVQVPTKGPEEIAEVAEAVNGLAVALRTSENREHDFLMSVSHDLRTPLTAVRGYAESLADGVIDPADVATVGAVITAETKRVELMVQDLIDLARLRAGELTIRPSTVDLIDFLQAAGTVYADRCARADVTYETRAPNERLLVRTDPERLRQALDGLFDNALRVTPAHGRISVTLEQVADEVVLEMTDTGPGLTEDDLAVAFERGELHRRYRGIRPVGSGLGLAIVKRLMAALGGDAEAVHAPGGGAAFRLRLPRQPTT